MSDTIKIENPTPELPDETLDAVTGGVHSRVAHKAECKRCGDEFPSTALFGGYCSKCLDELHKQGVYPPI